MRYALTPAIRYLTLSVGMREAVVPILEAGPGLEPQIIEALADTVDAVVLSLPGAGHVAARAVEALETLAARKPVVFASRTGAGRTLAASYGYAGSETDLIGRGLIPAGALDARKARILMLMLLSNGASVRLGARDIRRPGLIPGSLISPTSWGSTPEGREGVLSH